MLDLVLGGDLRMLRSYNRHGREEHKIVQITCDIAVERDLLEEMRRGDIKRLPQDYNPFQLSGENPAWGNERRKLQAEHARQVEDQWNRPVEEAGLGATRLHFRKLCQEVKAQRDRVTRAQNGQSEGSGGEADREREERKIMEQVREAPG